MPATTEGSSSSSASGAEPTPDSAAAPAVRRLAAFLTDLAVLWPVPVLLLAVLERFARILDIGVPPMLSDYSIVGLLLLEFLYFAISEGRSGQSLGKRAFRLEVTTRRGDPLTLRRAVVRTLVFLLVARGPAALILVVLGPRYHLWAVSAASLLGASGLHDVVTGTRVSHAPGLADEPSTAPRVRDLLCPVAAAAMFLWPFVSVDSTVLDDATTFSLLRAEAEQRSAALLAGQGYDVRGYQRSITFWEDDEPFKYLRKRLGWQRAWAAVEDHRLPLAGWRVRFFRPLREEQFTVWWALDRRLIGFRIDAAPQTSAPAATRQDVYATVSALLLALFPAEADQYALVAETAEDSAAGPARAFVWRQRDNPLDMRLYLRATAVGTEVRALSRVAEVPESFARAERDVALRRSVLNGVAWFFNSILSVAVLVFLLVSWQRQWLRPVPIFCIAGTMTALRLLSLVNELPLYWSAYSPREVPWVFWVSALSPPLVDLALASAWTLALLLAADAAGRLRPHGAHSLGDLARPRFYLSEACVQATLAGLMAVLAHRLLVDLFYALLTSSVGTSGFAGSGYSNLFSTRLPWLRPFLSGLHTALTEEAAYRLFAISIILRWTGRRWLALGAPAMLWTFLHTWYDVEPIYARGVELTAVALLYGALYLRFGIWSTIVAHYTYNAWVTSGLVQVSGDPWLMLRTAVILFLPTIPLFLALVRQIQGRWPTRAEVAPLADPPNTDALTATFHPRSPRPEISLNLWLAASVAALAALAIALLPGDQERPSTTIDRTAAIEIARSSLAALGHDLQGFRAAATMVGARDYPISPARYIRPSAPVADAQLAGPDAAPWTVRFFAPGRVDECTAQVGHGPALTTFHCRVDDSAPGQTLDLAASRHLAEQYLKGRGVEWPALGYVGFSEEPHPHRTDHVHRWVMPAVGAAATRTFAIKITRGRVSSFTSPISPSQPASAWTHWTRAVAAVAGVVHPVAALALLALAVRMWWGLRVRHFWDRRAAVAAGLAVLVVAIDALNHVSARWVQYDTATRPYAFAGSEILAGLEAAAQSALAVYVVALLSLTLLPRVFKSAPGSPEIVTFISTVPWKWYGSRGAFAWALAILLLQLLERKALAALSGRPLDLLRTEYDAFATVVPVGQALVALASQLFFWAAVAVGAAATWRYWGLRILAGVALLWLMGAHTSGIELVTQASLLLFVLVVARFHLPFYFWYSLLAAAVPFLPWLAHGSGDLRRQAVFVCVGVGVLVVMLFTGWRRRGSSSSLPT